MDIITTLQQSGYRVTKPRLAIINALHHHPQTVQEISSSLKKQKVSVDMTSIYRTLEVLVEKGLVHSLDLGGDKKSYELIDHSNHHHHLVCNNCGDIEDVVLEHEEKLIEEAQRNSRFQIISHSLEFFGLCEECK